MRRTKWATAFLLAGLMAAPYVSAGSNTPVLRGDVFVFTDGTRVRATDPAGRTGQVQGDGSIRWADGTSVSHDTRTGESRLERPDGRREVTNSHAPTRAGDSFVYSDGTRVRATDPSGAAGVIRKDGSIAYSDGTIFSHDVGTGDTKTVHGDGRVDVVRGGTPTRGADGNFVYSDGTRIRGSDQTGSQGKINPDGTISYPDGTRASHDTLGGDTKFVSPDGTVRVINGRTGTDKTTSPGGRSSDGRAVAGQTSGKDTGKPAGKQESSDTGKQQDTGKQEGKETAKTEKPQAEKVDKPAKEDKPDTKGRMVQGYGDNQANSPRLRVGGVAGNPAGDGSSSRGQPKLMSAGAAVGPGTRPGQSGAQSGALLRLPAHSLVINPGTEAPVGGGGHTVIDAFGGRR